MAGPNAQKRRREDAKQKASMPVRPRKIKKQREYHSSSEDEPQDETTQNFKATNLLDSDDDDDIHNAAADDGATSADDDEHDSEWSQDDQTESNLEGLGDSSSESEAAEDEATKGKHDSSGSRKPKSKRNDPDAFATSLNKILNTKLSSTRRADPVLSRSTDAAKAAREAEDNALESKARRKLREQKKQAKEKGRIRDVLVGSIDPRTGEPQMTISEILADEKRLRKIATRGVVKMFNAIRQAQVGAAQAEKLNRQGGVLGHGLRDENVVEMSKEAFLDLIAKGGGGLSKKPLEEA